MKCRDCQPDRRTNYFRTAPSRNEAAKAPDGVRPGQKMDEKKGSRRASLFRMWSGRRVSNSRPQPWQGCALPTELLPHFSALLPICHLHDALFFKRSHQHSLEFYTKKRRVRNDVAGIFCCDCLSALKKGPGPDHRRPACGHYAPCPRAVSRIGTYPHSRRGDRWCFRSPDENIRPTNKLR